MKRRRAVLHANLALVRAPNPTELNALLSRAALRDRCVVRLRDDAVLFPRSALPAIRRRLAELGLPFRLAAPHQDAAGGTEK